MLTKSMAIELAKAGVRVNAVCPASVDTPFLRGLRAARGRRHVAVRPGPPSPMGRLIDPAEVAGGRGLPGLGRGGHHQRHHPGHRRGRHRLTSASDTVSVSRPERRTRPGRSSVTAPSVTTSTPATKTWSTPQRSGVEPLAAAGQVVRRRSAGSAGHRGRVEDHQIGVAALGDPAPVGAARSGGPGGRSSSRPPPPARAGPGRGPPRPAPRSGSWRGTSGRGGRRRRSRRASPGGPSTPRPRAAQPSSVRPE